LNYLIDFFSIEPVIIKDLIYASMDLRFYIKFFTSIRIQFGINTCNLLKEFVKLTDRSIMLRIRIKFLNSCIRLNLTPQHLNFWHSYDKIRFFQKNFKKNLKVSFCSHVRMVLRLEVDDAYKELINIRNKIYKVYNKIVKLLPWFIAKRFFVHQDNNNKKKWSKENSRISKKIEWLIIKKNDMIKKDIKPIKYFYDNNNRKELKISLKNETNSLTEINISPNNFILDSPLNELHDNWFVNLSKKTIPDEVKYSRKLKP